MRNMFLKIMIALSVSATSFATNTQWRIVDVEEAKWGSINNKGEFISGEFANITDIMKNNRFKHVLGNSKVGVEAWFIFPTNELFDIDPAPYVRKYLSLKLKCERYEVKESEYPCGYKLCYRLIIGNSTGETKFLHIMRLENDMAFHWCNFSLP